MHSSRFISVDDHVQEHPEVWTRRLSKARWGDRIPHLKRQANGTERWVVNGQTLSLPGAALAGAALPDRAEEPQRWEDVPKVAYDPQERLNAIDMDGVDYSVLYPSVAGAAGETFGRLTDPEFELACVQAYNDWLIEEWASVSKRFIPQCIVPIFPPETTIAEIKRAVAKGHKGVIYPAVPMELREVPHINDSVYDPIWATCQDLGVPVCFHAGASRAIQIPPYEGYSPGLARAFEALTRPVSIVAVVVNLLISRVLLRYPRLKIVFAESALGWGAYLLEYTDFQFKGDQLHLQGYDLTPSQMFKRQCYLVGWYDRAAILTRQYIGTENILWGAHFPLATSTWPRSQETIERSFEGVPEEDRRKILWENAARLYGI
ncbi:MAG: amidohydrolase family protein [Candidatus Binatia bacterium]